MVVAIFFKFDLYSLLCYHLSIIFNIFTMSVPAKKASRTQTRARRKANMKITLTKDNIEICPKCSKEKLQHKACSYCGYYK